MNSNYDKHDFDKLTRWYRELLDYDDMKFNYIAVFVTREYDEVAHKIFRGYRRAFESKGATFANLVIFGQHGFSATGEAVLRAFHSESLRLPILFVIDFSSPSIAYKISLPSGSSNQVDLTFLCDQVLSLIEASVDFPMHFPRLGDIREVVQIETGMTFLPQVIEEIITNLSI